MAATTYEYNFVKIELKTGFKALSPKEDYHEIIEDLASKGWRLVQVFAPPTAGSGLAHYFELILERPRE